MDNAKLELAQHIRNLVRIATGDIKHLYRGQCPDDVEGGNVRDCKCPACLILIDAEIASDAILN